MQTKVNDKVRDIWQKESGRKVPTSEENENDGVYTVSAAVRLPAEGYSDDRPLLPFFSCPRRYSDFSQGGGDDPGYLQERFEESDVLGPTAVALKANSVEDSVKLILSSFPARDTIMTDPTPESEGILRPKSPLIVA